MTATYNIDDETMICTISGDNGLGKTTMGCLFPDPVVISAERGMKGVPVKHRPETLLRGFSYNELTDSLRYVLKEDHNFKTLVVDTVTALETMFIEKVIADDPKKPKGINQAAGGYGNGPKVVASMHQSFSATCLRIAEERKMNIVYIAHADTETIDLPDRDPYMRYALRMNKLSIKPYVDDSDVVGFLRLEMFLRGDDQQRIKKAVGGGDREFDCTANPWSIAKNRFGITESIPYILGENPLAPYLKSE